MGRSRQADTAKGRVPWVTLAVVVTCLGVLSYDLYAARGLRAEFDARLDEAVEYFTSHPYLVPSPELERRMGASNIVQLRRRFEAARERRGAPPIPEGVAERRQETLDALASEARSAFVSRPVRSWGVRSGRPELSALFGHVLFHSGWLHLLGNAFFLIVLGFYLEAAWGPVLFALFLFGAAPTAASSFALAGPAEEGLFIGTSALVCALLAAYAVRFRSLWQDGAFGFLLVSGTVWVAVPVWLGVEWSLTSGFEPGPLRFGTLGASTWAYGAGAGYGLIVALAITLFRLEEALVDPARDAKLTRAAKPLLEKALAEREAGRPDRAFGILARCLERHPDDCDVALALWDVAHLIGRPTDAAEAMLQVIRDDISRRDEENAVNHWLEFDATGLTAQADTSLLIKIAPLLRKHHQSSAALSAVRQALERSGDSAVVASRVARVARDLDPATAEEAAWRALGSNEINYDERRMLETMLGELQKGRSVWKRETPQRPERPVEAPEPPTPEPAAEAEEQDPARPAPIELGASTRSIRLREIRPLGLEEGGLAVEGDEGGKRVLNISKVEAIAVAAVNGLAPKPVIVVDLVLNWMTPVDEPLRVVRMRGDRFDPRRLVADPHSPAEALRSFIQRLLRRSGATPLPDESAALGHPFAFFDSLADYQRDVLMTEEVED